MNRYGVKDVGLTIFDEGALAGARVVVVRFSGCNLWDGHKLHRGSGLGPCARWCDADFYQGTAIDTVDLRDRIDAAWRKHDPPPLAPGLVLFTGGEPLLQLDEELVAIMKAAGWRVAVETNGTIVRPWLDEVDHLIVSPKARVPCEVRCAHELKVTYPGQTAPLVADGWTPRALEDLEASGEWGARFVVPQDPLLGEDPGRTVLTMDPSNNEEGNEIGELLAEQYAQACVAFVLTHPTWRLSVQTNKLIGLR